ncbi:MAG: hypothetical protein FJ222_04720 [Lentisphaerae bacterium]|nr:hypothetical protein [Lentisphaerota bacterium]
MHIKMSIRKQVAVAMAGLVIAGIAVQGARAQDGREAADWNLNAAAARAAKVAQLREQSAARREQAWKRAAAEGWSPKGDGYELQAIRGNRVYIYHTRNVEAALSTAANLVRTTAPYNVSGTGGSVGVWDEGSVRSSHQEFGGRVVNKDGVGASDHSTHVGGTIGASGVDPAALGMAPGASIDSYDWNSDTAEMTAAALAAPGEAGKIQLSNHSYGYLRGWDGTTWYGVWPAREDEGFGQYDDTAATIDALCYNAPYYLPCKAAGNDRNDNAPSADTKIYYYSNGKWRTKTYNPATDPYSDGYDNGGFDTIGSDGTAKNILTVGAVTEAVSGGVRSVAAAAMSSFSCWGPTDDGRIKPDVVGNGVTVYSSLAGSDTSYGTYNGTSMATPNVCGSAALLTDYYGQLFPGQFLRASSLKGLIIHTADDLGRAGPDYTYGWGLMNTKAAADLIRQHAEAPTALHLMELTLDTTQTTVSYGFTWDGTRAIRATLCWTDPAGPPQSGLDTTNRVLVNDLDLRIVGPAGQVHLPYVLTPANPTNAAATGTNQVDTVEQVFIAAPAIAGVYRVVVSLRGGMTGSSQPFSVILSGSTTSAPSIVTTALPASQVGVAYNQSLTAVGGATPYVWSLASGRLPSGLNLSSNGVIGGTPDTATMSIFTVRVTDANSLSSEMVFNLETDVLLFAEGFEHGGAMPAGWTQAYVESTVDWIFRTGSLTYEGYTHPPNAHGGSYNALLYVGAYSNHITKLVTPVINFGSTTNHPQLVFWHYMEVWGPDQDELRVYYKTSAGGTWTQLAAYTNSVAAWTQRTLTLPNPNASYYIAFEGNAKWGYGVCVDDVSVTASAPPTRTSQGTPYAWLDHYGLVTGGNYEAADAGDTDADGYFAWQEYVAGTEPTNNQSVFLALIAMSNALPRVTWTPDLGTARAYTVVGRTNLTDGVWDSTNSESLFFRINVGMP